jgi:hypothetical protein
MWQSKRRGKWAEISSNTSSSTETFLQQTYFLGQRKMTKIL